MSETLLEWKQAQFDERRKSLLKDLDIKQLIELLPYEEQENYADCEERTFDDLQTELIELIMDNHWDKDLW